MNSLAKLLPSFIPIFLFLWPFEETRADPKLQPSLSGSLADAPARHATQVNPSNANPHHRKELGLDALILPLTLGGYGSAGLGPLGIAAKVDSDSATGSMIYGGALSIELGGRFSLGGSTRYDSFYGTTSSDISAGFRAGDFKFVTILRNLELEGNELDIGVAGNLGPFRWSLDLYKQAPISNLDSHSDLTLALPIGPLRLEGGLLAGVYSNSLTTQLHGGLGFNFSNLTFGLALNPYNARTQRELEAYLSFLF